MLASYEGFGALLRAAGRGIAFFGAALFAAAPFRLARFFTVRPANRFFLVAMLRLLEPDGHNLMVLNYWTQKVVRHSKPPSGPLRDPRSVMAHSLVPTSGCGAI